MTIIPRVCKSRWQWFAVFLPLLTLVALGCGSGGKGTVTGTVTYGGKLIPNGVVTFQSAKDNQVYNGIIKDGKYSVPEMPTGPAQISVVSTDPSRLGGGDPGKLQGGMGADAGAAGGKKKASSDFVEIPQRYADPQRSELSLDVQKGEQEYDINLKP